MLRKQLRRQLQVLKTERQPPAAEEGYAGTAARTREGESREQQLLAVLAREQQHGHVSRSASGLQAADAYIRSRFVGEQAERKTSPWRHVCAGRHPNSVAARIRTAPFKE